MKILIKCFLFSFAANLHFLESSRKAPQGQGGNDILFKNK